MVRRLLLLNGLATLGVVLNHAAAWGFIAMFWWTHTYRPVTTPNFDQQGSLAYFGLRVVEQLITPTIPAFLFVSALFGVFAADRTQNRLSWKGIGTRHQSLLIPYLLWSLVIFLIQALQGTVYSPGDYLTRLVTGRATAAFYFVPLLCQLLLLSPILVFLAQRRWKLLLVMSALIQFTVHGILYLDSLGWAGPGLQRLMIVAPSWLFPGHLFWFTFGIVSGFHLSELQRRLVKAKGTLLLGTLFLLIAGIVEWEVVLHISGQQWLPPRLTILDDFYAGVFILCFLAFEKAPLPFPKEIGALGARSFGIYLAHSTILEFVARTLYHVGPAIFAYQILFQPILIVSGLGVPLLLMSAVNLNRSPARRYYRYVFG